jgi:hypothetical protein
MFDPTRLHQTKKAKQHAKEKKTLNSEGGAGVKKKHCSSKRGHKGEIGKIYAVRSTPLSRVVTASEKTRHKIRCADILEECLDSYGILVGTSQKVLPFDLRFHHQEELFDGIHVWQIRWQVFEKDPLCVAEFLHLSTNVNTCVVHD